MADFKDLVEALPDALVGVDKAGVIRLVNRQTESLFGYDRNDLVGMPLETLVPESARQVHPAHREGFSSAPTTRPMGTAQELSGRRRDGTEFPVAIALSPMDTGDLPLVIAAVRDMTSYRRGEAVRRQAYQVAAIAESSGDAIISGSLDGSVTSWNLAAERMFGYSSQEIIGKSADILAHKDRASEVQAVREQIKAGKNVEHLETKRVRKDGTVFPVLLTVSPIRNADGAIAGTSVIYSDLTRQQGALASAQRIAAIVEHSQDAIIGMTLDGTITSWNPAAEKMFGYSSQEIIGRSADLLMPEDRAGEAGAVADEVSVSQPVEELETKRVRKDGTAFPVLLTLSPICDAVGTVVGESMICRDVTKQKEASDLLRSMIEASLDSLVAISPEGTITDANEATVRLTGVPRSQLIGTSFSDYFTEPEKAEEIYQLVFTEGMAVDYPLTLRRQDGHETFTEVLYNASVYRDASGKVLGVFAAARDVTRQRQAQRENAEQQAKALERLAQLEHFQRLTVGRELKMIELKKEIEHLRESPPAEESNPGEQN
jgi:PAS domain S-box-containing protein